MSAGPNTRACCTPPAWTGPPGPGVREDYSKHRPHVERAIAQVATWRGRRLKLRYRGETADHAWLKRRTAALNLRNLPGHGLARRDNTWHWPPDQAAGGPQTAT